MSPDAAALATVHWPAAVRMARSWQRMDRTEAESDAGLLVCELAEQYLEGGNDPEGFERWLTVALRRRLIDLWRSRNGRHGQRRPPIPVDPQPRERDGRYGRSLEVMLPPRPDPADVVDLVVDLEAAIVHPDERDAIGGALAGFTLDESGARRGVTGSRMCQIRAALRERDELAGWRPQRTEREA